MCVGALACEKSMALTPCRKGARRTRRSHLSMRFTLECTRTQDAKVTTTGNGFSDATAGWLRLKAKALTIRVKGMTARGLNV